MKMRFIDKVLLALGGFLILAGGVALAGMGMGILPYTLELVAKTGEEAVKIAWPVIVVSGFLILWGLYLISVPCRMRYNRRSFVVQKTESGELRIAIKAIESLVKRCLDMHDEMKLVTMRIYSKKSTVVIALKISLSNNVSIPLAVASLQKQIRQYLLASSGIEVHDISVTVDTTNDASHESPYTVNNASVPETEVEDVVKEKKKPLHQRLFSSKNEEKKTEARELPQEPKEEPEEPHNEETAQEETVQEEPQKEITVNE